MKKTIIIPFVILLTTLSCKTNNLKMNEENTLKDEKILIFDEDCDSFNLNEWDNSKLNFLLSSKEDIIKLNLDTKYQTLKWFIVDLISQKNKTKVGISDDSEDSIRYFKKI